MPFSLAFFFLIIMSSPPILPQLSVLPTCQSQLDVIPVACAVLIDLAAPALREPLQLSHFSDALTICYLTVNEVSSSPITHIQSISNCSLLSSSSPSTSICPPSLPIEDLRSVILVQALLLFSAWNRCGQITASQQSWGLTSCCILLILCQHMSGSRWRDGLFLIRMSEITKSQ